MNLIFDKVYGVAWTSTSNQILANDKKSNTRYVFLLASINKYVTFLVDFQHLLPLVAADIIQLIPMTPEVVRM